MLSLKVALRNTNTVKALDTIGTSLRGLQGQLNVGINPNRRYYARHSKPVAIATVAAINEFGGGHVPERRAIRTALARNAKKHVAAFEKAVAKKQPSAVRRAMEAVGRMIARDIRGSILRWNDPPNAESTKKKKGFNNPLVWTQRLANAFESRWIARPSKIRGLDALTKASSGFKGSWGKP